MATAATAAPQPPFVVGRPSPGPPTTTPATSDWKGSGFFRRSRTSLGVSVASSAHPAPVAASTAHTAAMAALTRNRHAATSQGGAWPRIVVRDVTGRTLDTFTTLQDAIYRASWNVKTLHEWPKTSLEWRLPKAPVPSRPDYSRAGTHRVTSYSLDLTRSYRNQLHSAPVHSQPVVEIDVDDVSFVAESLRLLPHMPSFAFLRHSLLAGGKTYLRIVGSLLLHQRQIGLTDKREPEYTFPGFCTGCKRAGFCYGCDKNPKPHVHEDIPMRTGGGFRYFRRDLPVNQHAHRDPRNWSTGDSDLDLFNIIERCGGLAAYERAAMLSQDVMQDGQFASHLPSLPHFSRVRLLHGPWPGQKNTFTTIEDSDKENIEEQEEEEDEEEEESVDGDCRPATIATDRPWRKSALKKESVYSRAGEEDASRKLRRSVLIDTGQGRAVMTGEASDVDDDATAMDTSEYDSGFETTAGSGRRRRVGVIGSETPTSSRPSRVSTGSRPSTLLAPERSRSRSKSPGVAFGGSLRRSVAGVDDGASGRDAVEETPEERRARLENIPFALKRDDVNYQAPTFFAPKRRERRSTVSKDPFSRDREYNIPKGGQFQLKKGPKKTTKFFNVKRGDSNYKPPKKFELKDTDHKATEFWSRSNQDSKGKGRRGHGDDDDDEARRRRRRKGDSEDSELDSAIGSASTRGRRRGGKDGEDGDDKAGKGGKSGTEGDENENDDGGLKGAGTGTDVTGDGSEEAEAAAAEKRKRKEVVKKQRRAISPPGFKIIQRTPSPPPRQPTPEPTPPATPPPPSPSRGEPQLPDITLPEIPNLPEWKEKEKAERQKKLKFMVAPPPPPLKDGPKKRRPPPRVRKPLKLPLQRMKTKPAEAPVGADDVQDMNDPLDWLAKYCIINPDRLPLYEMVFEAVVAEQKPRYFKPEPPTVKDVLKEVQKEKEKGSAAADSGGEDKDKKKKKGSGKKKKGDKSAEKEQTMSQLSLLQRSLLDQPKVGLSLPEQQLEKLCYTLDTLHDKLEDLSSELQVLDDKRTKQVAVKARELFPEVAAPDYTPKRKKKGKKSKSKPITPAVKLRHEDITDDVILARLDDKMLAALRREPEVHQTELEIGRAREKISDVSQRLQELAGDKLLTDAFCMNHYFAQQEVNHKPSQFRRQQSELYNRLHPDPDYEMNLEEVEDALQQINGHLLTQKEFFFLYNVLNLPARSSINFRLFSVIAALSEKVTQLDPVIRKMINNTDYNALDVKMEKCRELFQFLEDDDLAPRGGATADRLAVELTAGGLTPEHTRFVLTKFNREKRGVVDFLDFVTYVPLFILIHRRIISHPLREELDL
ncbi:uncharacterized protein [Littorina saxatilis]|uniref:uncharacterized protein isoform X2 n=1 Tax=Littorina saxatilis TaxID=31220 RepID=UPI0038B5F018